MLGSRNITPEVFLSTSASHSSPAGLGCLMDEQSSAEDALEYWIDAAWLAAEQNVPQHGGGHEGRSRHRRSASGGRERRPKGSEHSSASSRNNSEEPPARAGSSLPPRLPQRAWRAPAQEEARQPPDNLARLQRNIEELERKIASAAVVLSEAMARARLSEKCSITMPPPHLSAVRAAILPAPRYRA